MAISDRRPRQKILQEGDFDFLLAEHSLQLSNFLLFAFSLSPEPKALLPFCLASFSNWTA
jgi:hypothetical protein